MSISQFVIYIRIIGTIKWHYQYSS